MKLNEIFDVKKGASRSSARSGDYIPPLIRELAGDPLLESEEEESKPNEWSQRFDPNRLSCAFHFDDPSIMRRFITEVLDFQEDFHHHGKLLIEVNLVQVDVWTHDVNAVTELDREYAQELTDIFTDVMGIYGNVR